MSGHEARNAQLDAMPGETRPDARTRMLNAQEHASAVFTALDELGPSLPLPERTAALELRAQAADLVRRLSCLAAFVGGPS